MNSRSSPWLGDWKCRILECVHTLGFRNLTELMTSFPSETYPQLARRMGGVAPVQIQHIQFEEAEESPERILIAAKDALVRLLREHCRRGWKSGHYSDFGRAGAKTTWLYLVSVGGRNMERKARAEATWSELIAQEIPRQWVPTSPDDPFIHRAFENGWRRLPTPPTIDQ